MIEPKNSRRDPRCGFALLRGRLQTRFRRPRDHALRRRITL